MDANQTNTEVPVCGGCAERDRRIAQLKERIGRLEKRLEELSRSGKRQAAPFSRGFPKADPKKPGRKSGEDYGTVSRRAIPAEIDEVHEAPLPGRCPRCGGSVIESRVDQQYQVEIPRRPIYRQFNVHIGRCACCECRVQGRHPLQTSDALGCCASQVGPEAQAAAVMLNKELGLSQGKISQFFRSFFGIDLSRGGSCQIMLRAAGRCQGNYQAIVQRVQQSQWIVPDETGWRIGGGNAWLHAACRELVEPAVSEDAVAYLIAPERGFAASQQLIGEDYGGYLIHDGWAGYDRFWQARHQTCLAHLLRRCRELLETTRGGAVIFPRQIKALLQKALAVRDQRDAGAMSIRSAQRRAGEMQKQMDQLLTWMRSNPANERLAKHLCKHSHQLFTFLDQPGIDATNYRAEQALRPAVVNRKVWGGNRTEAGAIAQSILMTVLFTASKLQRDALSFLSQLLRAPPSNRPLLLA